MDEHYDLDGAVARLEIISASRRLAAENHNDPTDQPLENLTVDGIIVHDTDGNRKQWRLCKYDEDDKAYTEMVFRVQGILVKANLIPSAANVNKNNSNKAIYISQRAGICGYDVPGFVKSMQSTEDIHSIFERHFPHGTMNEWTPPTLGDEEMLIASTRLFTMRDDAPGETDQAFGYGVDSNGLLQRLKGTNLVHLDDNKVTYLKRTTDQAGRKANYEEASPAIFRVGDIVELELYFVAFQRHDMSVKMTTRMQGLTLLDASFSKSAEAKRRDAKRVRPPKNTLKRKAGTLYEDEKDRMVVESGAKLT